ncbi:MAG TPA: DinB family protein [Candidatus Limnocylindrales bacterium]|nr:DinB family protein [Candidatus Limnocylindrales bacterium]
MPDEALERTWKWRERDLDVRYGFYRQYEALADTRARIGLMLSGSAAGESAGRPVVAAAAAAYWDLHGLIAPLTDEDLDRDPGHGEWTVRQTLAHIVSGQRGYGVFTAWWLSQRHTAADDLPSSPPDELELLVPEEEEEGIGTVEGIDARLAELIDQSAGVFGPLGADDLALRARWSSVPLDVGFRVNRWSSHIREHTIQVEKTLVFIGRPASEVDRLVRLIAAAYGRLEEPLYLLPDDAGVSDALRLAETTAAGVLSDARSIADATGAAAA